MKNVSRILWGVVLIILGIIIGTNSFGITHIDIFFTGWWTLFIIVPCFINLFDEKESQTGNFIGLLIGCALLLVTRGILDFEFVAKLIMPCIFIGIGLSLICSHTMKNKISEKVRLEKKNGLESIVATFSEQKVSKEGIFKGANLDAVFGCVTLDLRQVSIEKEAVIVASAIFGSVDILVPDDVEVKVKATPIFGGVSNHSRKGNQKKTLYIEALCLFGGMDIK